MGVIKLKDLTNEQYDKWRKKLCVDRELYCENCPIDKALCHCNLSNCWICNEDIFSEKFLNQEIEIEDEPILDAQEKAYLENLLRPFKNRRIKIKKALVGMAREFIIIAIMNCPCFDEEFITLPFFEVNKMYKGMERERYYTLKDLGLFQDE